MVVNTADPASAALAAAYCSAWGIPTGNIVSVNLGNGEDLTSSATLNTARTAINNAGRQYTALSADFMTDMAAVDVDLLSAVFYGRAARPTRATSRLGST